MARPIVILVSRLQSDSSSRVRREHSLSAAVHTAATQMLKEVGEQLGYNNATRLSVNQKTGYLSIGKNNDLTLSEELAESISGNGPYTKEEIRAIFAHEVSHRILQHAEKVEAIERAFAEWKQSHGTKTTWTSDEATQHEYDIEESEITRQLRLLSRKHEFEADAYPVKQDPSFASHLISALSHLGSDSEVDDSHPAVSQRMDQIQKISH
jgi:hypothetical protein